MNQLCVCLAEHCVQQVSNIGPMILPASANRLSLHRQYAHTSQALLYLSVSMLNSLLFTLRLATNRSEFWNKEGRRVHGEVSVVASGMCY